MAKRKTSSKNIAAEIRDELERVYVGRRQIVKYSTVCRQ